MLKQNFENDELFRLVNFPSMDAYLASLSKNENEAITKAEENLLGLKAIVDKKLIDLNFVKLRSEFKFTLETKSRDDIQDYSTPEAAIVLKRTSNCVRSYIKKGWLKSYRTLNGDYRITRESIEEFINAMRNGQLK